jgi:hypothetical protein
MNDSIPKRQEKTSPLLNFFVDLAIFFNFPQRHSTELLPETRVKLWLFFLRLFLAFWFKNRHLNGGTKAAFEQYMTPARVSAFMVSLFLLLVKGKAIRLLDPGAGVGSLSAAFVQHFFRHRAGNSGRFYRRIAGRLV